jgi:hypothetical protein
MKYNLLVSSFALLLCHLATAQMKQTTTIGLSTICNTTLSDWDNERAVVEFNPSRQTLEMSTDVLEILDNKSMPGDQEFIEEADGMPLKISVQMEIPDLDFKTSADNGQTFKFDTVISCNGVSSTQNVTYIFFYAPLGTQRDNSPLIPFRFDFVISIDPTTFGLDIANGCNEIVLKVQDALLNKVG